MNRVQRTFVAAILCNDEVSTDDELIRHFINCQLTEEEAKRAVALRSKALRNPLAFKAGDLD